MVKRIDDDVAVFVNPTGRQHERRSKHFWAYDLRLGLSPWTHLRLSHDADLTPPSCLPADVERIRKLMHVIELRGLWHTAADVDDSSDLRGITGPGDVTAPSHVHVDTLRQADGTETYALITGNLYGLPTACRTYTKERHRLILERLPQRTGWTASKLLREPCCYHLNTGHKQE